VAQGGSLARVRAQANRLAPLLCVIFIMKKGEPDARLFSFL